MSNIIPSTNTTALEIHAELPECGAHNGRCHSKIDLPRDGIILAWLHEKTGNKRGWKTHVQYHQIALNFCDALRSYGTDIFADISRDEDFARTVLIIQQWAGSRLPKSKRNGDIQPATYNNRLSIISSLYEYAKRTRLYRGDNPIDAVTRQKVKAQDYAREITTEQLAAKMGKIDVGTSDGLRDYALLMVAWQTAQRVSGLAGMRISQLEQRGEIIRVHFPLAKGDESDAHDLNEDTTRTLVAHLSSSYGEQWRKLPNAPVWMSLARNDTHGMPLSIQALEQISLKRLGTSKFHASRHSAAMALDRAGYSLAQIQAKLRHKNVSTTSKYVRREQTAENEFGDTLTSAFTRKIGIEPATADQQ